MRIVCVSDTHNLHNQAKIPDGDIFVHAGDITAIGEKEIIVDFNRWLGQLPHKHKIIVAGNHDFYFEKEPFEAAKLITNAIYLNNCSAEIEGFKIWGSPVSPISQKFGDDWAFNKHRGQEIRSYWELIPDNTDILITHCPPYGILDTNELGDKEGCKDLLDIVENRIKPRLHIFGHIHEAHGQIQVGQTKYVNASIVGLQRWISNYKLTRQLRVVALSIFVTIKQIRKKKFRVPKDKLHVRTFTRFHWEIKNRATIIDI